MFFSVRMGGHRRLRLYSRKNYERKKRQKGSFLVSLPLQLYVQTPATTLEQLFFQVGTASLTFTPRYICITCQFEFGVGIVFLKFKYVVYTDWKCELREGVLNIIKLGYKGTVTTTDSAILFPTTLMEPVNWCENVPFPIPSV